MASLEVLYQHFPGNGKDHHEVPHDSRSLERDLSLGSPECEAELSTLDCDLQWGVLI